MARIRTVKPEFWASEQVMECSPIARLLFIGLWNFCDDAGNPVDSEKTIKAEIFPGDDISSTDVRRLLDELSSNSLITFYASNDKGFLHVNGWHHQKIDKPTVKHPPFPGTGSSNARRTVAESSPPEGKGREGKGKDVEQSSLRSDSSPQLPLPGDSTSPPADLPARKAQRIQQIAQDAQAAYNRILAKPAGLLTACTVVNKPRMKAVEKSIPTAKLICQQLYRSDRITPQFWDDYFAEAERDDFHAGRGPYRPPHENWRPDFEFLLREDVMAKLFDRAQSAGDDEAAA